MQPRHGTQLGCQVLLQLQQLAIGLGQLVQSPGEVTVEIGHGAPLDFGVQVFLERRRCGGARIVQQRVA